MRSLIRTRVLLAGLLAVGLGACASPREPSPGLLAPSAEQAKLRSMQTRTLDFPDRNAAVRGVMAALQDLGFIIERANEPLGLVTAARFAEPRYFDVVEVTVTVRSRESGRMTVRANAIYNNEPITDPEVYQSFFTTLQRSAFLDRN